MDSLISKYFKFINFNLRNCFVILTINCFLHLIYGCQTSSHFTKISSSDCSQISKFFNQDNVIEKLDDISELYFKKCYDEVILLGPKLRTQSRDKLYSLTAEVSEVFFPEGTFTEYTLESHERAYLSLLISLSYYQKNDRISARVEFLKSIDDTQAQLYNYGNDLTILILQATLADTLDIQIDSRPFWNKIAELSTDKNEFDIKKYAENRISEIDSHKNRKFIIKALGYFPELDWKPNFVNFSSHNNYTITTKSEFPQFCTEEDNSNFILSTKSWFNKINLRYHTDYHPLLNFKSWARLPAGLTYGIATVSLGGAIIFGGCAIGSGNGRANGGEICKASIEAGATIMSKSTDIVAHTMEPDLRHWKHVPLVFLFGDSKFNINSISFNCFKKLPEEAQQIRRTLFDPRS